jgi:iron(III) transport system permease protein
MNDQEMLPPGVMPEGKKKKIKLPFTGWNIVTFAVLIFFALFFVYPLLTILIKSVWNTTTNTFDFTQFNEFFANKYGYYQKTVWNSVKVSLLSAFIATALGTLLAYIMRTTKVYGSKVINIILLVTMVTPPFLSSYAWIILLGRAGIITKWLNSIGIAYEGIYGFAGICFVFSIKLIPLVNLYVSGALKQVDKSLLEASESLGGHGISHFFKIVFPLILPTILASAVLVFMRVISDFGVPSLIGEGYRTLPTLIYNLYTSDVQNNEPLAATICLATIFITTIIFLAQRWLSERKKIEMSALRPIEPIKKSTGIEILANVFCYLLLALLVIPMIIVVIQGFMDSKNVVMSGSFTFQNFIDIFTKSSILRSVGNTFLYSFAALLIVILLGVIISYLSVRKSSKITRFIDTLSNLPYIIPGSVLGIALLFAFNKQPLALIGTAFIIILNYVIRRLPYTIRSSTAILHQIDLNVEEASQSLGANPFKTFFRITVPMMMPGVMSGATMSWLSIITELSGSIILYSNKTKTMSIEIFNAISTGNYGYGAALSALLMLISTVTLLLFFKFSGKKEIDI